jgi:LPXTG-motif cell wall-anchored protein
MPAMDFGLLYYVILGVVLIGVIVLFLKMRKK